MSITIPPIFTPMHDEEAASLVSSSEETMRKVVQNANHLANLLPVGAITYLQINQYGTSALSGDIYQLCNGSEIVNPKSPLRSPSELFKIYTPDLNLRFPRGANAITGNVAAGSNIYDLLHSHGGGTSGTVGASYYLNGEEGDERTTFANHGHTIPDALANGIVIDAPVHMLVAAYLKIS